MTEASIPKARSTIYIEPNLWKTFKKVCDREDKSMSEMLEGFIARYVAVHAKGNPQLLLEPFIGETKKICYNCRGKFPVLIHVKFISNIKRKICRTCKEEYDKRTLIKKVLV